MSWEETIAGWKNSADMLRANTEEHQLTVLHEDGLYRHIRLAKPGTGLYRIDLVTWPGHLSVGGDMDGFTFARLSDMFEFFRDKSGWNHDRINPQYWAEKLVTRVPVKKYSEDVFRRTVAETIAEAEDDYRGLKAYADQEIGYADEDDAFAFEESAREWLRDFKYVVPHVAPVRSFEFTGSWEWDFSDWDHHYLYACHAIQWGIEQYDKARVAVAVTL